MTHAKLSDDDDSDLGPAMRQLTEKQRKFVQLYIAHPLASGAAIAKAAGYKGTANSIKVEAFRQLHNERTLRAINEQMDKCFRGDAVIARHALLEIVQDKSHPQRLRAAEALLGRGGFPALSEQKIHVTHEDLSGPAMIARIEALALELGVDARKLIGPNNGAATVTIEHEPVPQEETA